MKKTICIISLLLVVMSAASACGRTQKIVRERPEDYVGETHSTTEAQYTVGKEERSMKNEIDKNTYELLYVDSDGNAVKNERYYKNRLRYYCTITATDENGNGIRQNYYDAEGNLFASEEYGYYYDGDGKQISEEMMEYLLLQYQ